MFYKTKYNFLNFSNFIKEGIWSSITNGLIIDNRSRAPIHKIAKSPTQNNFQITTVIES